MEKEEGKKIIEEMLEGYGEEFSEEELWGIIPTENDEERLDAVIPALGRYLSSVAFLKDVTSGRIVSITRFKVMIEYFLKLSRYMANYDGIHSPLIGKLDPADVRIIRSLGEETEDILRAEYLEKFTDHDTAAAGDYLKILIAKKLPHLAGSIEAVNFANTSEDTMGNVFGIIANRLVFGHFMSALCDFVSDLQAINHQREENGPLILPAFSHQQGAEPTTDGKKLATRLNAIRFCVDRMRNSGGFQSFSGKLGGAVGNSTCHYAAYPDIAWDKFAWEFVSDLGLHYEELTDQCASYAVEAQHFMTIANILTQIIKLTKDFVNMSASPAQFFVKKKKAGAKGSSLMPNKSNAWGMEGAVAMLRESRSKLLFLACELPDYPHEGDMARSYLFRNIGDAFMPIFIALKRITREMRSYRVNQGKIDAFFHEYPGMAGSSIQTLLKTYKISGDAYRIIQNISINPDGGYADAKEFRRGLDEKMEELQLSVEQRDRLRLLIDPRNLAKKANEMASRNLGKLSDYFQILQVSSNLAMEKYSNKYV